VSKIRWVQLIGVAFILGAVLFFIPRLDFLELWEELRTANKTYVLLAVVAVVGFWLTRSLMLWLVLRTRHRVRYQDCYLSTILGMTTDQVIPGRVGYLVRWGILFSRCQLPKALIAFALLTCVMLEALGLLSLFATSLVFDTAVAEGQAVSWPALVLGLCIFGVAVLILYFLPYFEKWFPQKFLEEDSAFFSVIDFLRKSRRPGLLVQWFLSSILMWTIQAAVVLFVAASFEIDLGYSQAMLLLVAVNLATLVPLVPGNIGSLEIVCVTVLMSFGVASTSALAVALLYHFVHLGPLLAIGGLSSLLYGIRVRPPASA